MMSWVWRVISLRYLWDKGRVEMLSRPGYPTDPPGRWGKLGKMNGGLCGPRFLHGPGFHRLKSLRPTEGLPHTQVSLQLASGAFLLNQAFCEAIHIPMDKLKWTSPFTCHRASLTARQPESKAPSPQACTSPSPRHPSVEPLAEDTPGWEPRAATEHTGKLWATVVALAWLEHSSASYFTEWELVAAKASWWLEQQEVPEGRSRGTLKAAALQLFVLLRHWDESLEFNMLCYNPNYV